MRFISKALNVKPSALFSIFLSLLISQFLLTQSIATTSTDSLVKVPKLTNRVTDLTNTLNQSQINNLDSILKENEEKNGTQVAILLVNTTAPEEISQYSIRVVEAWKLGRKGIDDGVLLLVAKKDRRVRIEVGYGLEGALTDAKSKQIISELIVPYFQNGLYFDGISSGINAILLSISKESLPLSKDSNNQEFSNDPYGLLIFVFVGALVIGGTLKRFLGVGVACFLIGGISGALIWLLTQHALISLIAALIGSLATLVTNSGGIVIYGGNFPGMTRGSGIDDQFRGGGGGFGGGGASGEW